jgi:hypothetical protein
MGRRITTTHLLDNVRLTGKVPVTRLGHIRVSFHGITPLHFFLQFTMLLILALLLLPAIAQRADNESLCDYYATQLYGANTTTNQYKLLQSIFALAFAGGSVLLNASNELTGIFNPGTFGGVPVNLVPWFDGSIASTNLNNQPVAIDWLDGGQTKDVFTLFLTGQTSSLQFSNATNELYDHHSFIV